MRLLCLICCFWWSPYLISLLGSKDFEFTRLTLTDNWVSSNIIFVSVIILSFSAFNGCFLLTERTLEVHEYHNCRYFILVAYWCLFQHGNLLGCWSSLRKETLVLSFLTFSISSFTLCFNKAAILLYPISSNRSSSSNGKVSLKGLIIARGENLRNGLINITDNMLISKLSASLNVKRNNFIKSKKNVYSLAHLISKITLYSLISNHHVVKLLISDDKKSLVNYHNEHTGPESSWNKMA